MSIQSFEEFLFEIAEKGGVGEGMPKDRFIEAQEQWIQELGADELLEYGQKYGDYVQMKMTPKDI